MIDLSRLLRIAGIVAAIAAVFGAGWVLRGASDVPEYECVTELTWAVAYNMRLADVLKGMADENSETYVAAGRIAGLLRDSAGGHAAGTLD